MPKKKGPSRRSKPKLPPLELDYDAIDNPNKRPAVKEAIYNLLSKNQTAGYKASEVIEHLKQMVEGVFTLRYVEPILEAYVNNGQLRKGIKKQKISNKPKVTVSLARPGLLYRPVYNEDTSSQYQEEVYYYFVPPEQRPSKPKAKKGEMLEGVIGQGKNDMPKKAKNHKGTSKLLKKRMEYRLDFKGQKVSVIAEGNKIWIPQSTLILLPIEPLQSGEITYSMLKGIFTTSSSRAKDEMLGFMDELAQLKETLDNNVARYGGSNV